MDRKLLIDGKNSLEFNYSWLRDNCQCSQCLHQSTQQKLHSSGQVALMKPIKAEFMDQERIKIFWPKHSLMGSLSEHVSTFSLEWLKRHQSTTTSLNDAVNWTGQMLEPLMKPMEYSRFKTNQGFKDALCNLKKYGIQFLQSVPTANHQQVEEIGKSFGHIQETFYGVSWDVKSDPNSKNIAYTSLPLGLHMDLMYLEAPPGLQILHCLENTVNGGTSLFMDIHNAVKELRSNHPKEFKILCSVPVLFHYMNDGKHYEFTRPTIKVGIDGNCSCYYSPPFQGPLNCSPKDLDGFYSAFSLFETLIKNEKYLLKHLLKPGEAVLFANQRVLHGREGFDPSSGKRWLKGTYVAWDEIQNNFRTNIQSKP